MAINTPRRRLVRYLYGIPRITFWKVGNRPLNGYSIRKSLPLACATWCITATPTSTPNRRIIVLRKPPIKSYATSRKVACVALYEQFKGKRKRFGKIRIFFLTSLSRSPFRMQTGKQMSFRLVRNRLLCTSALCRYG